MALPTLATPRIDRLLPTCNALLTDTLLPTSSLPIIVRQEPTRHCLPTLSELASEQAPRVEQALPSSAVSPIEHMRPTWTDDSAESVDPKHPAARTDN